MTGHYKNLQLEAKALTLRSIFGGREFGIGGQARNGNGFSKNGNGAVGRGAVAQFLLFGDKVKAKAPERIMN